MSALAQVCAETTGVSVRFFQSKLDEQGALLARVNALNAQTRNAAAYISKLCSCDDLRAIMSTKGIHAPPRWLDVSTFGGEPCSCADRRAKDASPSGGSIHEEGWPPKAPAAWSRSAARPLLQGQRRLSQAASGQNAASGADDLQGLKDGRPGQMHWKSVLAKMSLSRQFEVLQLLADLGDYSKTCSVALLMATPKMQLVNSGRNTLNRKAHSLLLRLEKDIRALGSELDLAMQNLVPDSMLRIAQQAFLRRLAADKDIQGWMEAHGRTFPPDLLRQET